MVVTRILADKVLEVLLRAPVAVTMNIGPLVLTNIGSPSGV
jgi:hypothetical protein